jgi:hypothetical protein
MAFKPERFLGIDGHAPEPDTHNIAFGFGRRVCPGRVLADNSVFLSIAQSLAVFNINSISQTAQATMESLRFQPGIISHPVPFKASIKPRSHKHELLVRSVEMEHPWEESDSKRLEGIKY